MDEQRSDESLERVAMCVWMPEETLIAKDYGAVEWVSPSPDRCPLVGTLRSHHGDDG
jgi:hypothetical protein